MTFSGRRLAALLSLALGACAWAPFPESLLDGADAGVPAEDRDPGAADDPRQTSRQSPSPADPDAGPPGEPDSGPADDPADPGPLQLSGEREPNDSMADAQPAGLPYTVLAEWTPAGDDDWYSVSLERGDVLDVRTRSDDGGCDFDSILLVYAESARPAPAVASCSQSDPAAELCIDDVDGSPCARVTFEAPEAGTYYVRAVEYGDDEHALYVIDFEVVR